MGIRFRCDRWAWRARRCLVDTFWEIRHDLRSGWTAPFRWWFSARLFCWKTHDPWWFLSSKNASSSSSSLSSSGWWYTYPSEKYEFVSWDDYFQYMESHKSHVTSHQPVIIIIISKDPQVPSFRCGFPCASFTSAWMSSGALGPREAPSLGIDMGYEMMETDIQDMGYRTCHQEYDMTDLTMFPVARSYFIIFSPKQ